MSTLREFLGGLHLQEYEYLLTSGYPPLYIQLVIANALVFLIWIMRRVSAMRQEKRVRGAKRHQHQLRQQQQQGTNGMVMAGLLVMANAGVLLAGNFSS